MSIKKRKTEGLGAEAASDAADGAMASIRYIPSIQHLFRLN